MNRQEIPFLLCHFEIPGRPVPLKRHRTTRTGHRYDPSLADKQAFLQQVRAMGALPAAPLDEPLAIDLEFVMPRAKSHFRTGRFSGQLKASAPRYHTCTPDVDNLAKFVLDALNTYMYRDDACIVTLTCRKLYSTTTEGVTRVRVRSAATATTGGPVIA